MTAAADPTRRAELAAIHVAAKQLALAEDSYRAIVSRFSNGRTDSAGAMTAAERRAMLDHFRQLGFAPRPKAPPARAGARRLDLRPHVAKLRALWLALWQLGIVDDPRESAIGAFVQRHTGIEAVQWTTPEQLNTAIECLKQWCKRVGYTPAPFTAAVQAQLNGSFKPGLIEAQWQRLEQLGAFRHGRHARLDTWLVRQGFYVSAPQFLEDAWADEVINQLGRWIRRLVAEGRDKTGGAPADG